MGLKTLLLISITTLRVIFPGLPGNLDSSQQKAPATREFSVELMSDKVAPKDAYVRLTLPEGLDFGPEISLQIDRSPLSAKPDNKAGGPLVTIRTYWGGGESVPEGQPRVTDSATPAPSSSLPKLSFPEASLAYWPALEPKPIKDDATTQGIYTLNTDYCGNTSVTLEAQQNFLAPIDLIGVKSKFDLEQPIKVVWKAALNAKAYLLVAYGGTGLNSITWTSGSDPDLAIALENRPLNSEDLKKYVEAKILLPSTATSCTIPAGIFKGSRSAVVTIVAFGKDIVTENDWGETRVILRSKATMPLFTTSQFER